MFKFKKEKQKITCNIGWSSLPLWIYINGTGNPIRGRSDANCDVICGEITPIKDELANYMGENFSHNSTDYLEYSDSHIIKIREGWNGFSNPQHYGVIKIKPSLSPFTKIHLTRYEKKSYSR